MREKFPSFINLVKVRETITLDTNLVTSVTFLRCFRNHNWVSVLDFPIFCLLYIIVRKSADEAALCYSVLAHMLSNYVSSQRYTS